MRTIKFRAWDEVHVKMVCGTDLTGFTWFDGLGELNTLAPTRTLEQFTGLLDKNGKEIYEGDVVKGHTVWGDDHGNEEVDEEWQVSAVVCSLDKFEGYKFSAAFLNLDTVEVIGNIHENPSLLAEVKGEVKI